MRSAFLLFSVLVASPALRGQSDWPAYGGDLGNTRYSALDQINSQNITNLGQAWVYDTRPRGGAKANRPAQATPLVVNDVMYLVTAYQSLVALQPETGNRSGFSRTSTRAALRVASHIGRATRPIPRKSCLEPGMVS